MNDSDRYRLERIRRALTHQMPPLSLDDQRWLYTQLTGHRFVDRRRCVFCDGEGGHCSECNGSGYQQKQQEMSS